MSVDDRSKSMTRLHALMAHTVANGCTEDEELAAARMAGRLADEIQAAAAKEKGAASDYGLGEYGLGNFDHGAYDAAFAPEPRAADRVRAERESADYRVALERSTMEGLLKNAVQEMSMAHLNTVSPPGKRGDARRVQMMDVRRMLLDHLSMALGVATAKMSRDVLQDTIEELIQDGMLPARLAVPLEP